MMRMRKWGVRARSLSSSIERPNLHEHDPSYITCLMSAHRAFSLLRYYCWKHTISCDIVEHIHSGKIDNICQFDPYGWIAFQVPSLPVLEDGKDLACLGRWAKKILVPLHEAANELNRRPCSKCAPKFFINSDPNFTKSKYDDGTKWCRRGSEHQFNFKKQLYHASCCHILKNDSSGATLIDHYDDKWYPCLECHKTIAHIPQLER